jgi:hypothetical protein
VAVEPAIGWLQEVLRWCDHWMKGRDTGIMNEPMLRAWVQESVPPQTCYDVRPGRWVGEAQWPSPRIRNEKLFLNAGGILAKSSVNGATSICSPLWVGIAAGEIGRYGGEAEWPPDQREDDGGSLVFVSEPLAERVEILGAPTVTLSFASDKPQALVCARLNDVAPDGRSTRVTYGLLNLTHRNSHEHPEALVPGQRAQAVVEMDDIAHAFPPGHRIAVSISTTYWPVAWPSPELATVTLFCGETALNLPVRPPNPDDAKLRLFDPPEMAPLPPVTRHPVEQTHPRRVLRDLLSGRMTVDFPRWTYSKVMHDIGQTQRSSAFARYEITDGDPLSATLITEYDVEMVRPDATITHRSRGRLTCDGTHFIIEMDLCIEENGETVFERHWHENIARDMV